jgi:hypothetical protein
MDLTELQRQIARGPALVVGPGATTSNSREADFLKTLLDRYPVEQGAPVPTTYLDYADNLIASGTVSENAVRKLATEFFSQPLVRNPQLELLIKANWTAVVSLCSDAYARDKLGDFLRSKPIHWEVSTVAVPGETLSITKIPYYALLGDIADKRDAYRLAVTTAQYLKRTRAWSEMLRSLPDVVKGDPIVFIGTSSIVPRVRDFINELLRLFPRVPRRLIFLSSDDAPRDPIFRNLIADTFQVQAVDATLAEIGSALSEESLSVRKLPLFSDAKRIIDFKVLASVEDQVAYVPQKEEIEANPDEHNRLIDSLFRPTNLDWSPYALGMEFRRDVCGTITNKIEEMFLAQDGVTGAVLDCRGESGIGKTVALRSVAFELAQQDYLCLWVKKSYGEVSGGRFDAVTQALSKGIGRKQSKVVFFLDDPWGSRVRPNEVIDSLQDATFPWVLIIGTRKSDMLLGLHATGPDSGEPQPFVEISAEFSADELARLPQYLVTLRVAPDLEAANAMMPAPGMKQSRDVLCSLWYLLPQTQSALEESLIGEYHRLGEIQQVVAAFATAVGATKGHARTAYEYVTTTSGFNSAALPVEVLVSALGGSYDEWRELCNDKKPLWGLLYDEEYPSAETYAYRTRNTVVTEVLLRALNRGTAGHTGEFRCLKELIRACNSATAPYRTFLKDILVDRRGLIQSRFNYEQAVELYELAEWAYPRPYPLLQHHKCLIKRHLGGDVREVYEEIRTLIAKSYDKTQPDQDSPANLHTSAAAAVNQMIRQGKILPADGANAAFEHITAALEEDQFSLHAHHVHAELLVKIATELRPESKSAFMATLERAARIIDRALLLIPPGGPKTPEQRKSMELFQRVREDIMTAFPDVQEAREAALELFRTTGDQTGLAFAARVMLERATQAGKGQQFKKVDEFIRLAFSEIASAGVRPNDPMLLCRVELVINWHLRTDHGPVYWEQFLEDLVQLQQNPRFANDVLCTFYAGVAHFNLRQFVDAESCFQRLRGARHYSEGRRDIRGHFLGDKTDPRVFEGRVTSSGGDKRFVYCAELSTDILVKRGHLAGRPDESKHFKIGFSMLGPIAVDH